jgi:rubrerythrin
MNRLLSGWIFSSGECFEMARNRHESLADTLQYASILEEKAYSLYKTLADKVDNPLVKSMLLSIAFDSQKHSAIFRGFSESMGKPTKSRKDYEMRLGETLITIDLLEREIAKKETISYKDVSTLVKNLTALESTVGEEYFILVQAKTLQFMKKEIREIYNVDMKDLKGILEGIIQDEEKHEELLAKIKKILMGKESKPEERTADFLLGLSSTIDSD